MRKILLSLLVFLLLSAPALADTTVYGNLEAPGPIGSTTPNTGAFTTLGVGKSDGTSGGNANIYATLGVELAPVLTAAHWDVVAGWDLSGSTLNHSSAGAGAITPTPDITIVAGTTYRITVTFSAVTAGFCITQVSGTLYKSVDTAGTYTWQFRATTTVDLRFIPSAATARFIISAVSIKSVTDGTGDLTVEGNLNLMGGFVGDHLAVKASLLNTDYWLGVRTVEGNYFTFGGNSTLTDQVSGVYNPIIGWGYNKSVQGTLLGVDTCAYIYKLEGNYQPDSDHSIKYMEHYKEIVTDIGQKRHDFEYINRTTGERWVSVSYNSGGVSDTAHFSGYQFLSDVSYTQKFLVNGVNYMLAQSSSGSYANVTFGNSGVATNVNFTQRIYTDSTLLSEGVGISYLKGTVGIGTSTSAYISERLNVWDGNTTVQNTNTVGTESLNEPDFSTHVKWTEAGGFAFSTNKYVYTDDGATHVGSLTQTAGNRAIAGFGSRWYKFTYDVVTPSGTIAATITTGFAGTAQTLSLAAGTGKIVYFKSATGAAAGAFVISATSSAAGTFTLDNVSLKEVQGGDVFVGGYLQYGNVNTTTTNALIVGGGQNISTKNTGWIPIYVNGALSWMPYWTNATP